MEKVPAQPAEEAEGEKLSRRWLAKHGRLAKSRWLMHGGQAGSKGQNRYPTAIPNTGAGAVSCPSHR